MVFCNNKDIFKCLFWVFSHNPYFSRWFSAISLDDFNAVDNNCHNPYFSRWFSAIKDNFGYNSSFQDVTILILVDGFLQYRR